MKLYLFVITMCMLVACTSQEYNPVHEETPETGKEQARNKNTSQGTTLNISILLDLSDRISPAKYPGSPSQYEKDIAAVKTVVTIFKNHLEKKWKTSYDLSDRLNIFFHPQPADPSISTIAQCLQLDLGELKGARAKKNAFMTMDTLFSSNVQKIYSLSIKNKKYEGANIWRFLKDEVTGKCISSSKNSRNILIVITDGYMYWQHEKRNEGNKYSYIERNALHLRRFRNTKLLDTEFDKLNFGFIPVQKDLSGLEVIVVGIAPSAEHPEDYDILVKYWSKWLTEMKVKRYELLKTDLPVNTGKSLKLFIEGT